MPTSTTTGLAHSLDYSKEGIAINATRKEQWRPIPGYEGLYEVSNIGQVRSLDHATIASNGVTRNYKGKLLTQTAFKTGHLQVKLTKAGKQATRWVHQLVAAAFLGERQPGQIVRHLNDVPDDNRLENLAYGTQSDNMWDLARNGGNNQRRRTHCPYGHELTAPNLAKSYAKRGHRACLACARARSRIYRHPEWKDNFKALSDTYYAALIKEHA